MSNVMMILDILIVLGLVVSAVMAVHFEKLLSAVISLGVTGLFAAAAFLLMHAPDVAISEANEEVSDLCFARDDPLCRHHGGISDGGHAPHL